MDVAAQKIELKNWIDTITDPDIIDQIMEIKSHEKFDFEKEWARSISGEELRKRTKKHIDNLH